MSNVLYVSPISAQFPSRRSINSKRGPSRTLSETKLDPIFSARHEDFFCAQTFEVSPLHPLYTSTLLAFLTEREERKETCEVKKRGNGASLRSLQHCSFSLRPFSLLSYYTLSDCRYVYKRPFWKTLHCSHLFCTLVQIASVILAESFETSIACVFARNLSCE